MSEPAAHNGQGPLRRHAEGVVVEVQVVPNASQDEVVGRHGARLRVRVSAPAERGKANRAVVRLLASTFGVRADLMSGARSKIKRFLLRGLDVDAANERMNRIDG